MPDIEKIKISLQEIENKIRGASLSIEQAMTIKDALLNIRKELGILADRKNNDIECIGCGS